MFNCIKHSKYVKYTYTAENIIYIAEVISFDKDTIELNDIYCSTGFNRGFGQWFMYERDIENNFINLEVFYSKDDIIEYFI